MYRFFSEGLIPKPTHPYGRTYLRYTPEEAEQIINVIRSRKRKPNSKTTQLVSIRQLALRIGISPCCMYRFFSEGLIPKPTHPYGRRLGYTAEEADQIANRVIFRKRQRKPKSNRKPVTNKKQTVANGVATVCGNSRVTQEC
jgi:predicted site-specific integrase-resolvase